MQGARLCAAKAPCRGDRRRQHGYLRLVADNLRIGDSSPGKVRTSAAGWGATSPRTLARLGTDTRLLTAVGNDQHGHHLLEAEPARRRRRAPGAGAGGAGDLLPSACTMAAAR